MTDPSPAAGNVGVLLPRDLPIAEVVPFARRAEQLGFAELWIVEDLGFRGGIAQAATVLAATSDIQVGIGILPAASRNVAFAAMEVATLAQLHPGRLIVGIGHGMPVFLRAVGAWPDRPLTFLSEYATALAALLAGEAGPDRGRYIDVAGVRLEELPDAVPPIVLGVRGPRSLAAAGVVADGVVLAEPAPPTYIAHARDLVTGGGATSPIIATYDLAHVDADAAAAHEVVRPALAVLREADWHPHFVNLPYADELVALAERSRDGDDFAAQLPTEWIADLTLTGTADDVRRGLDARFAAGATSIVLTPLGTDRLGSLESLGTVLTPRG